MRLVCLRTQKKTNSAYGEKGKSDRLWYQEKQQFKWDGKSLEINDRSMFQMEN